MAHSTLRVAWRNLGRNRKRTALAVGAIALSQLTLVFVNCLMAGSYEQLTRALTGPLVGHVQLQHPEWRQERAPDMVLDGVARLRAEIADLPQVRSVSPRVYSPVLAAYGEKTDEPATAEPAVIVGVDVPIEARRSGLLADADPDQLPAGHHVLLGRVLANRLGVRRGQLVAVIGQDVDGFPVSDLYHVAGTMRTDVALVNETGIVMDLAEARRLLVMRDQAHELLVRGEDYEQADALADAVRAVPRAGLAEVITWREAVPELTRMLDMKSWVDFIFVGIVFIAAAAGISNVSMMSTFERRREFGMLLALGMRPRRVVGMVLVESVIQGVVGVAVGSALGVSLVLVTGQTGIDYAALGGVDVEEVALGGVNFSYVAYPVLELRHVLSGLVAVTVTSIVASLWPASLAARLRPAEALRS